jgi:hypothetical protein
LSIASWYNWIRSSPQATAGWKTIANVMQKIQKAPNAFFIKKLLFNEDSLSFLRINPGAEGTEDADEVTSSGKTIE